jgi:hypothetical protein
VALVDFGHTVFSSDAQPATLSLAAFPDNKVFTVSFITNALPPNNMSSLQANLTGFAVIATNCVLLSPASGMYVTTATPTLTWSDDLLATSYSVQVSRSSSFAAPVFDRSALTTTSFTIPAGVLRAGIYYWQVLVSTTAGTAPAGGSPATFAVVPACPADFNASGTTNVQDIFDFLAAWFAADPRANINGVGGVTVQDIFDFLAAWFAGCT